MLWALRRAINIYRKHGFEELQFRAANHVLNRFDRGWLDINRLINKPDPVVVDGGAHRGKFVDWILDQYYNPEIHAFEPNPNLADRLQSTYNPSEQDDYGGAVYVYELALGKECGSRQFNVSTTPSHSSFLESSGRVERDHGIHAGEKREIHVSVVRLDENIDKNIDILKLDLEGYELTALKGSTGLLDRISMVFTEVEFVPMYDGAPLFCEIHEFMNQSGFGLYNLYPDWEKEGQLESKDALYLNRDLFPSIYS